MKSALYSGFVRHRRFFPKKHAFRYRVFMVYLCIAELDKFLSMSPFWSKKWFSIARFRREDFHGDPAVSLLEAVKCTVEREIGRKPAGEIFALANFRYFGVNINPLSIYYCFDKENRYVDAILAEVTNTPWNERKAYVFNCESPGDKQLFQFEKNFTVSPFNTRDMFYKWYSNTPDEKLSLHISCLGSERKVMDATLSLRRKAVSPSSLNIILAKYPFMTMKIFLSIYWQALRLFLRRVPFLGKDRLSDKTKNAELEGYEVHCDRR